MNRGLQSVGCAREFYNDIMCQDEKAGDNLKYERSIRHFVKMVFDTKLIDCGNKGCKFTWSNNREGNSLVKERLDRALYFDQ